MSQDSTPQLLPDSLLLREVSWFHQIRVNIDTEIAGGCKEVVLDAELVAIDRGKANELKSFQELSTRARGAIAASEVHSLSFRLLDSRPSAHHHSLL